jgi:hypothetical protein
VHFRAASCAHYALARSPRRDCSAAPISPLRAIGNGEQVAINKNPLKGFEVKYEKEMEMSVQLQIEEMPEYLAANFTGAGTAEEVWQRYKLIAERCNRANKNKLLLDFTEAYIEASLADKYILGEQAQIFARYKVIKSAAVARPEQVDPERFGEMVARNRLVNARVFTNAEDALEWLLSSCHIDPSGNPDTCATS